MKVKAFSVKMIKDCLFSGKKKKGVSGHFIMQIIGLALGAFLLVFVLIPLILESGKLWASPKGQATLTNLNVLADEIQLLLGEESGFAATRNFPFNIEEKYVIIGFDRNWVELFEGETKVEYMDAINGIYTECSQGWGSNLNKPGMCGDKACLCVYKYSEHEKEAFGVGGETPIECRYFDEDIVFVRGKDPITDDESLERFMTPRYEVPDSYNVPLEIVKEADYPYLFLYGKYYNPASARCTNSWNVRNIYIEKFARDDGRTNILIAARGIKEPEDIENRYLNMKAYSEFKKFIYKIYLGCEFRRGHLISSELFPYSVDESCSCGSVKVDLPEGYFIKIWDEYAGLFDSEGNWLIRSGSHKIFVEDIKKGNVLISSGTGTDAEERPITIEGKKRIYITKHDSLIGLGTEDTGKESCSDFKGYANKTRYYFGNFVRLYTESVPALFESPREQPCIIDAIDFAEFPLGEGKTFEVEYLEDTNELRIWSDPNVKKLDREKPCYIILDSEGKFKAKDTMIRNTEFLKVPDVKDDVYSLSNFPSLYLVEGRACFDSLGTVSRHEYGPHPEPVQVSSFDRCDLVDDSSKNAIENFDAFANAYENCANEDVCDTVELQLEQDYTIDIREREDEVVIARLYYGGRVVKEGQLTGGACFARAWTHELLGVEVVNDKEVRRIELGNNKYSFEKVGEDVCMDIAE